MGRIPSCIYVARAFVACERQRDRAGAKSEGRVIVIHSCSCSL